LNEAIMMKRFCVSALALPCLFALQPSAMAQANPWNGSWKAEPSSYKYSGPTYSMAVDADGFTMTRGGKAQPKIVCDGKPQKTDDTMTACVKTATGYLLTITKDGKTTRKVTVSVAADGKTRTSKSQVFPPGGPEFTMTTVSTRVSGGPGPAGEWKEIKNESSDDKGVLTIAVKGDMVDFKETDAPKPTAGKLDGTPTKFPLGGTMSIKLDDPHTLKVTYSDDKGEARRNNTFTLSADGKTITETDVTPEPSVSTMTVVLKKM
jgi:hypothetical protein